MDLWLSKHPSLPSAVQVGFSGSRELFDGALVDSDHALQLSVNCEKWLIDRLQRLPTEIRLAENQFLVGVSQLACGADTIFSNACRASNIPQRFFLPEHRDQFLSAQDDKGRGDFTPRQRKIAEELFTSEHVIQEVVVAKSPERHARFEETNFEILRECDVIICLFSRDSKFHRGGARGLLERACLRGVPTLEVQVDEVDGKFSVVEDRWHNVPEGPNPIVDNLPEELSVVDFPSATPRQKTIPTSSEYLDVLSDFSARQAETNQSLFKWSAAIIIATHVAATVLATLALVIHGSQHVEPADAHGVAHHASNLPVLAILLVELAFLVGGYWTHHLLHHSHAAREWAVARVVREIVRSVRATGGRHISLQYLFRVPLPIVYRPLLRTLSLLHLRTTRANRDDPWEQERDRYLRERLDDPHSGQIHFFQKALQRDTRTMMLCQRVFVACSLLAITATAFKVGLLIFGYHEHVPLAVLGTLAVTLPVLAVGGLSWSAAVDCEARVETFQEALVFLRHQRPHLLQAISAFEYDQLLSETETVLLEEVSSWYLRRANKGVT